jgi:hypothetical protein
MALLTASQVEYEAAANQQAFANLSDSGDHIKFTLANKPWSQATGFSIVAGGYGVLTGFAITPAAAAGNNNVDVAAGTLYAPGMTGASTTTGQISINAATNIACTRGTTNGYRITAITIDSSGAVTAVPGTESTAFTETRGSAGGPPLIPVGSVELGQVRFTSTTAAVVSASEIYQVVGTHQERSDYPVPTIDPIAGTITFSEALPLIHTGTVAKRVSARIATPTFVPLAYARNFVPATNSASTNTETYYQRTRGTASLSLGSASFELSLEDGVTDDFVTKVAASPTMLFKYKPDKNRTAYSVTQGIPSLAITNAPNAHPTATVTIAASQATVNFSS